MELLIGIVIGFGLAGLIFIVLNSQADDAIDFERHELRKQKDDDDATH